MVENDEVYLKELEARGNGKSVQTEDIPGTEDIFKQPVEVIAELVIRLIKQGGVTGINIEQGKPVKLTFITEVRDQVSSVGGKKRGVSLLSKEAVQEGQEALKKMPVLQYPSGSVKSSKVPFKWSPVEGASAYQLVVATDHAFQNIVYNEADKGTTLVPPIAWTVGVPYFWTVAALFPEERGPFPTVKSFVYNTALPEPEAE